MTDRDTFLRLVKSYVEQDPESAAYIAEWVAAGLNASRVSALKRAADMEAALATMLHKPSKKFDRTSFVLGIINKWKGKSSLKWEWAVELLSKKEV
jgi:hypothetical protein